jgi:hypothetical protein
MWKRQMPTAEVEEPTEAAPADTPKE